jgi:hypothetical protein
MGKQILRMPNFFRSQVDEQYTLIGHGLNLSSWHPAKAAGSEQPGSCNGCQYVQCFFLFV